MVHVVKKVHKLWERYERALSASALTVGFVFDLFIAKRPDNVFDNILLVSYLFIAATLIVLINIHISRRRETDQTPAPIFLLLIIQFCFGGLASNLLVLYGKSGTFAGSALFILLLAGMLVGNEFLQTRYAQLRFNIVVFYMLLLTYLIIAVPTFIIHSVGTFVFLLSGLLSVVCISVFLGIVYLVVFRGRERGEQLYEVSVLVGLVLLLFNALYFLQIIPPVPLSLKDVGVYHSISRLPSDATQTQDIYAVAYEPAEWYAFWRDTNSTFKLTSASQQAVCFSSVFAPARLSTPVFHRWEKYNEQKNTWDTLARISFPINGGRDDGYRGFTIFDVSAGQWRCDVETESGALIGRTSFTAQQSTMVPILSTKTL